MQARFHRRDEGEVSRGANVYSVERKFLSYALKALSRTVAYYFRIRSFS